MKRNKNENLVDIQDEVLGYGQTVSSKEVLRAIIYGWCKYNRPFSVEELATMCDCGKSTIRSRVNRLVWLGYLSNDHHRRPLRTIQGKELKMVVKLYTHHGEFAVTKWEKI